MGHTVTSVVKLEVLDGLYSPTVLPIPQSIFGCYFILQVFHASNQFKLTHLHFNQKYNNDKTVST